jgi:hypothetical protein
VKRSHDSQNFGKVSFERRKRRLRDKDASGKTKDIVDVEDGNSA